jgi:hypothetical protein
MNRTRTMFRAVRAGQLEAGQMVYISRLDDWFRLAAKPKAHRFSQGVMVLHFDGLPRPEFRLTVDPMRVRDDPET